ncbi:hypothetical protein PSEUDO8O_160024 [Pseudomonas sp. 8O]|nr:hypothetical protein PSEUDO8O_160024 [Pseudomonas sp. 8O]
MQSHDVFSHTAARRPRELQAPQDGAP